MAVGVIPPYERHKHGSLSDVLPICLVLFLRDLGIRSEGNKDKELNKLFRAYSFILESK